MFEKIVLLKSNGFLTPSITRSQPVKSNPDFSGAGLGAEILLPTAAAAGDGVGLPPSASNVTVCMIGVGVGIAVVVGIGVGVGIAVGVGVDVGITVGDGTGESEAATQAAEIIIRNMTEIRIQIKRIFPCIMITFLYCEI